MDAKKDETTKRIVVNELEKYHEIESLLGICNHFLLDCGNTTVSNENEARTMALRLRKDLNVGIDGIASVAELLENNGIKIFEIEPDHGFSSTSNITGSIPVIVINKDIKAEEKRFAIFVELGHLLLHFGKGVDEEKLCEVFASELLIPSETFVKIMGEIRHNISLVELQTVQRGFGISVDALMVKALMLKVITHDMYRSYLEKKRTSKQFKGAAEKSLWHVEHISRFRRLVFKALASEIISISKAATLLGCPVNDVQDNLYPV